MQITVGVSTCQGACGRETGAEQWCAARSEKCGSGPGIENRKRSSGLEDGYPADLPSAQCLFLPAFGVTEKGQVVNVADDETMRPVKIGKSTRSIDVALVIVRRVDSGVAGGSCVSRFRVGIGCL